jgi:hypothetical protein
MLCHTKRMIDFERHMHDCVTEADADAVEAEMGAFKRRGVIAPQHAKGLHRFVGTFAAPTEIKAEGPELLRAPPAADSEDRPARG